MTQQDLFYRAFTEYKKHTKSNIECVHFRRSSQALKSVDNESMRAVFATCTIEEDWIKAIEEGLPFVYKAIKEERQFIRNDGEVLPIEKVRKTSKYTIQDLAKHSNYISHEAPEHLNADIMPDKVLVIRKENDYTVYENRVVYALLLYLQEFISSRLSKIKELTNKYEASATVNKNIILNNRNLTFEMKLYEIIKDDPIAIRRNKYHDLIERIDNIYSEVVSLLKTPLMFECSKVDVVNRPITKTNVLRMNRNFKESLKLFDYIAEYNTPGYVVTVEEKLFNPLAMPITFDYSELMLLSSFITYMHVNGITEELKEAYNLEEKRLKKEEEDKLLARVRRITNVANAKGKTLEEYVLILDEANKILEKRNEELQNLMAEKDKAHALEINNLNEKHAQEVNDLNAQHVAEVNALNEAHTNEINALNEAHTNEVNALNEAHTNEVNALNEAHTNEVNELNENHANEVATLKQNHEDEVNKLNSDHEEKVSSLISNYEEQVSRLDNQVASLQDQIVSLKKANEIEIKRINDEHENATNDLISKTTKEIEDATRIKDECEAEILAIRMQHGLKVDPNDFTTEQRFNELEKEKKYLDELFNNAWKETKKAIRKKVMAEKPKKLIKLKKKEKEEAKQDLPLPLESKEEAKVESPEVIQEPKQEEKAKEEDKQ